MALESNIYSDEDDNNVATEIVKGVFAEGRRNCHIEAATPELSRRHSFSAQESAGKEPKNCK